MLHSIPLFLTRLLPLALLLGAGVATADILEAGNPWVRQPPPGNNAAAYLSIHNTGKEAVRVIGVRTDAAERAEMHRTVVKDGVARMSPVDELEVGPGETVELAPGGLHLMLIRPRELALGDVVELTLELAGGAEFVVRATVRSEPDGGGHEGMHH